MTHTNPKIRHDCLKTRHPISLLVFFACVIGLSMFSLQPIVLGISSLGSLFIYFRLCGGRKLLSHLKLMLILAILTAIINPLFNHRGRTVLYRFKNGNSLTFEAIFYGFTAALIVVSVLSWFAVFNYIFDSDKLLYVFGRFSPSFALTISMALRFVPEFGRKAKEISRMNRLEYRNSGKKGFVARIKQGAAGLGALLTWALEGSVKKAKSMRDRGFGRGKRTSYSIFRWQTEDTVLLVSTMVMMAVHIALSLLGAFDFWFYPVIYGRIFAAPALCGYAVLLLLMLLPAVFDMRMVGRRERRV